MNHSDVAMVTPVPKAPKETQPIDMPYGNSNVMNSVLINASLPLRTLCSRSSSNHLCIYRIYPVLVHVYWTPETIDGY